MKTLAAFLGAAVLVLGAATAQAGTIIISNVGAGLVNRTAVLSDLTLETDNPLVPFVVILKSNDATDDVTLKFGESFKRTIPQDITGYQISELLNKKEVQSAYLGNRTRFDNKVAFLEDNATGNPILLTANLDQYQDPPPEGTVLDFVNGTTPGRPDWSAQTVDSLGNPLGPYTGSATIVDESFEVSVVPEPSTIALSLFGILTLLGFGCRHAKVYQSSRQSALDAALWSRAP